MNKGRYVFRQMCDFLPSDKIEWIIEKYNGDRYTKTFSCWQHLLVMILAQLWQSRSLRVLVNVLNSQKAKLYQMGIGKLLCFSLRHCSNIVMEVSVLLQGISRILEMVIRLFRA